MEGNVWQIIWYGGGGSVTDEVHCDVDGPAMKGPHQGRYTIVVHSGQIRTLKGQKRDT